MTDLLSHWILTLLIAVPVIGAAAIASVPLRRDAESVGRTVRRSALIWSLLALALAVLAVILFFGARGEQGQPAASNGEYALALDLAWVTDAPRADEVAAVPAGYVDLRYHVGVDGLSLWLLVLTAGLMPICIAASNTAIRERLREYYALMLLLEAGMIGVFCARDLLLFYVFFEFTLVPLYFLIGIWGGPRRREAAAKFFIYTMAGSVLTFAGVLFLAYQAYALPAYRGGVGVFTFDLDTLYGLDLDYDVQWWLFLAFAAGFAIKVPLFPLHTWLPLAHTEAPTAGSVLLAGVLLKLGTYGFLRFSLPMLPAATVTLAPVVGAFAVAGIIYAALVAWVQDDIKKLIAYSSVSHLGFCILGMFSLETPGVVGSLMYMVNHGLSTGALFLVVGMVYERYHTRQIDRLGGLARTMPWLAFFLVLFTLSSIGLPGLNGYVGEFLVLLGTVTATFSGDPAPLGAPEMNLGIVYTAFAATGIILSAVYMLHLCRRLLFGRLNEPPGTPDRSAGLSVDLTRREIGVLAPIAVACVLLGVWPNAILDSIRPAAERQVLSRVYHGGTEFVPPGPNTYVEASEPWAHESAFPPEDSAKRPPRRATASNASRGHTHDPVAPPGVTP